ncbi:MAG: hypothetical protein Unbinned5930contig1000_32 [Prokaryotic dsDNA virus sp.]|nr:MAG: hypothetical protein Unbinned5930contig1000_32 [Prokaryotic dsDNA virus sp.]
MLKLKLSDKTKVEIPNDWKELRLRDWIWIVEKIHSYGLADPISDELSEEEKSLEDARRNVEWMKCSKEIFSKLSKMPMDKVNLIHQSDISQIINGLHWFMKEEKPAVDIPYFTLKGERYWFPSANMEHSTFEDFVEASQLDVLNKNIKLGRMSVVAKQMAILCRKEGETFDDVDKVIGKREKLFGEITMDVVWNFFFFLTTQVDTLKKSSPIYSASLSAVTSLLKAVK